MSERIENLQQAVEPMHSSNARHVESKPRIKGSHVRMINGSRKVTVLEIPTVDSAKTAVQVAMAASAKK